MASLFARFWEGLHRTLVSDTIPVWLSLLLMLIGAGATYVVAPAINAEFEQQAARREFLVKNLEDFYSDTNRLADLVGLLFVENAQFKIKSIISEINPLIVDLNFSAHELLVVVPDNSSEILSYQKKINELKKAVSSYRVGDDDAEIRDLLRDIISISLSIYQKLLKEVGF